MFRQLATVGLCPQTRTRARRLRWRRADTKKSLQNGGVRDHPVRLTAGRAPFVLMPVIVPGLVWLQTQQDSDWISWCLSKFRRCFATLKTHHIGLHGLRFYWRKEWGEKKKRVRCIFQFEYSINCQPLSGESSPVIPTHQSKRLRDPERKISSKRLSLQVGRHAVHDKLLPVH